MSQQALLFGEPNRLQRPIRQTEQAQATSPAPEVSAARPMTWRAPTRGEQACHVCAGAACYGDGPVHYCRTCVPAGFLPSTRGRA